MASGYPDYWTRTKTDIVAQTLSTLAVDIAAATVAKMNVDIIAQTIANLDINVNAQSLSEIINRPKYGGAIQGIINQLVVGVGTGTLIEIAGTGIIYGGFLRVYPLVSHKTDYPMITVDGNLFAAGYTPEYLMKDYLCGYDYVWKLINYNDVDFEYVIGIIAGITFESSIKLQWYNSIADTILVGGRLIYATI